MEFRKHFRVIKKHIWIVLLVTLFVVLAYGFHLLQQQPIYTAHSRILLRVPTEWNQTEVLSMPGWETRLATFYSEPFLGEVSRRLDQQGYSVSPGSLEPNLSIERVTLSGESREKSNYVKIYYQDSDLERGIKTARVLTKTYIEWDKAENFETLQSGIEVIKKQLREKRQKLLNAEQNLREFKESRGIHAPTEQLSQLRISLRSINEGLQEVSADLESTRRELANYRKLAKRAEDNPQNATDLEIKKSIIETKMKQLSEAQSQYHQLKQSYGPKHPKITKIKSKISTLEEQIKEERKKLPDTQSDTSITPSDIRKNIFQLNLEERRLETKQETLMNQKQDLQQRMTQLSEAESQYLNLQNRVHRAEQEVQRVQERLENLRGDKSIIHKAGEIVSLPSLHQRPSKPNRYSTAWFKSKARALLLMPSVPGENVFAEYPGGYKRYASILFGGLLLGIATAAFAEYLNNTINEDTDVKLNLDLPLLGKIPDVTEGELNLLNIPRRNSLSEQYHSTSSYLEEYTKKDHNAVLITSTTKGEGKTYTALNLGISMAREGEKVLLIDLDLRSPSLHKILNFPNSHGVSSITSGQTELEQLLNGKPNKNGEVSAFSWSIVEPILENTGEQGIDFLTSGPLPPYPIKALKSDSLQGLLRLSRVQYDIVLIDSPPIDAAVDPVVTATRADGVLVVIEYGKVSYGEAMHTKERLSDAGAKIIGIIMNRVPENQINDYTYYEETKASVPEGY